MKESEAIILINHTMPKGNSAIDIQLRGALNIAIEALEEKQQYRAIGTVEEFKALKEKNVTKKPTFYAHNYYCTECGNLVGNNEFEWQRFLYCDKCGQKLDWE